MANRFYKETGTVGRSTQNVRNALLNTELLLLFLRLNNHYYACHSQKSGVICAFAIQRYVYSNCTELNKQYVMYFTIEKFS